MDTTKSTFKIHNYGVQNIEFLEKYAKLEASPANIQALKDEVFDAFINDPSRDFSTKGSVSVVIVDLENMTNCEITWE